MNQHAPLDVAPIPFIDVAAQRRRLGSRIDAAVGRVLDHCQFVLGPEVRDVEEALAAFCGARHAVTCASGTDALLMVLMAKGIGPGDAVICPSFTFCATAEAVALAGATPVFADIDVATFNISPDSAARAVAAARQAGLDPRMIISVDLFGQPADFAAINALAAAEKLFVLDDAAQAFGAMAGNRRLGTLADATATSFFPAKPLGCYGDGGAVFTDDDHMRDILVSLRAHGQGASHYDNVRIGLTARLDSRDAFAAALKAQGIPTAVYYPRPLHRQEAYRHFPADPCGLPVSDLVAEEVISLPMHAYLDETTQDRIIAAVRRAVGASV